MTKEKIIEWLNKGYYVPVELRNGERCIIDPEKKCIATAPYTTEELSHYDSLSWSNNVASKIDIVKVLSPVKPEWNKSYWRENIIEELKDQLGELEREQRNIADRMNKIKSKMK